MTDVERIRENLDFISNAVRSNEQPGGVPAIYFLWAALIPIGFALPDFATQLTPYYWLVAGIGGGLFSAWLGARHQRRCGVNNTALGRRYGFHWLLSGVAFLLCFIPLASGQVPPENGAANFLLVAGITYALAGVHIERPLLYCGLVMLAAYAVMVLVTPPFAWTLTGLAVGVSLLWAGLSRRQALRHGAGA